jgi:polyribonucleotide nucleotidyltransferase
VIGTGGKVIREIVETGAKVDIDDDGTIKIARPTTKAIKRPSMDLFIVAEAEVGKIYTGKVVKTVDFGAFVNFFGARRPGPRLPDRHVASPSA